ncbi:MAG: phosphotransferase [Gammaproteobacteria bacterium]|nr:phosphotransferase [Gammaproteobacteria bacterium]MYK48300.1 phosphotransferase [Gammaproteobacteria bacterium]
MPAWGAHEIQRIEYLPGGYTNRNYRVEVQDHAYVLRIVEGTKPRPCERDYLALDVAPDVVAYDVRHGHLLTLWISGQVLADSPPSPGEAGEYLAALHARIPLGINRYDFHREVTTMFRRAREVDPRVQACFEATAWRPATWRGCHNDLNPWNIIRVEGGKEQARFRTLDWESAGDNDPIFDLVGLCVGLGWGIEHARACHDAYRRGGSGLGATEVRLRDTFRAFLIREYAWAVAQLAIGNDRDEIRAQVETSRDALANWD